MQVRIIGTRDEVAATLAALRASGMTVRARGEAPARRPDLVRVYATAHVPTVHPENPEVSL
jgi:hypothetical protein